MTTVVPGAATVPSLAWTANLTLTGGVNISDASVFQSDLFIQGRLAQAVAASLTADTDALDVSAANIVFANTTAGNITVGGLTGGLAAGHAVCIIKSVAANSLILEHNEGDGDEKMLLEGAGDVTLTSFGGIWLVFSGTTWFEVHR